MTKSLTELVTDAQAGNWTPSEHFIDMVIDLALCYGQLAGGKITAVNYDMAAGNGNTVNVPYVATAGYSCTTIAACDCLSNVSATLANYPINIYQYGFLDEICAFSEWKSTPNIQAAVMKEMAKKMANCYDAALWSDFTGGTFTQITTAGAWSPTSRPTDACCNYAMDIYNCIIDGWTQLKGAGYTPDTVLIHPYVAAYLYYKENGNMPAVVNYTPLMKHGDDGRVTTIAGMKVIEVCVAVADDSSPSSSGDELAYVFDSSRAIGEAWGMKPKFNTFYKHECNKTQVSLWSYWGHALMEAGAVREIISV